jgi:DNA-binding beta-propeller fold protein YncE
MSATRVLCSIWLVVLAAVAQQSSWFRQFGTSNDDQARAVVAVGSAVYVTGSTVGELKGQKKSGRTDSYLRRYDTDGNEVWTRQFGVGTFSEGRAVAASDSEVYVAGAARDDAFLRKFDANGKELWSRQIGTAPGVEDQIRGIALDGAGVYVAGSTGDVLPGQSSSGNVDAFVRKYDLAGNELWTRQFGSPSFDQARGIVVNASGVYVAGMTADALPGQTSAGANDAFLRKYDASGKELWTRQFGTRKLEEVTGIAADDAGIYVAGFTTGVLPGQTGAGSSDLFVRKYDAEGKELWTRQFGTPEYDESRGIAVHDGSVYVAGITLGTLPGQSALGMHDAIVVRLNADGQTTGMLQFGTSQLDEALGISVTATGIYVAGLTGGNLPGQKSAGNVDAFVAKLDLQPVAIGAGNGR